MHVTRFAALFLGSFLMSLPVLAQQPTPTTPAPRDAQAVLVLQRSLAALAGTAPVNDVTLSGTVTRIAGSDNDSGTATLKATAVGQSRVDLSLSNGPRSEVVDASPATATGLSMGSWSGPDGVAHRIADHNLLLVDPAWFFPLFPISRGLTTGFVASYITQEQRNGKTVEHLAIAQLFAVQTPAGAPSLAHLSQMDFFLDATTLLPTAVTFNIHPDNDAGRDFPVEVQFSDYRNVNGVEIPFHVQKFLNGGLILDLQFTSAVTNTGLSSTDFAITAK